MENYKCVTLKGDLEDWGKHILLPFGSTLCGMPTVDADKEQMPELKNPLMADMISEYIEHAEWDITCDKCLQIISLLKERDEMKKQKYN